MLFPTPALAPALPLSLFTSSCPLLKDLRRVRHDRIKHLLSSIIQSHGGVAQVEPSHFLPRPDILAFLPSNDALPTSSVSSDVLDFLLHP